MKILLKYSFVLATLLLACTKKEETGKPKENNTPVTRNNGSIIQFPNDEMISFFKTEVVGNSAMSANYTAPAKVAATITSSQEGASQNIILFEDPTLSFNYTELLTHQQKIKQLQNIALQKQNVITRKKAEVDRYDDLLKNGAGTGKDLADAQVELLTAETESAVVNNDLASEKTAIIEHETRLKTAGFHPKELRESRAGKAFVICEIPENQVGNIREGDPCTLKFNAFPNESYQGKIEDVADLIDQTAQMVKVRVAIDNPKEKFKAGMYATVALGIKQGKNISIDKNSLITVQGNSYVFVKNGKTIFERKPVSIGNQVENRFIVYSGLQPGDSVAIKGVMQLKGLSFGY